MENFVFFQGNNLNNQYGGVHPWIAHPKRAFFRFGGVPTPPHTPPRSIPGMKVYLLPYLGNVFPFFEISTVLPRNTEKRVYSHISASAGVKRLKFGMKVTYYRISGPFFENSTVLTRNTEKRVCSHISASTGVRKLKFGMKDTYYRISGPFFFKFPCVTPKYGISH